MSCYEYPPVGGGGGRVVAGLAQELVRHGHEVDVVTMARSGRRAPGTDGGVTVHEVPCVRRHDFRTSLPEALAYIPSAVLTVRRLLRRGAYDVVNPHFILPDGLVMQLARRRHDPPMILTAHGSDVPGHNPDRFKLLHALLRPLWRRTADAASHLVCSSTALAPLIRNEARSTPLALIPNGIDAARFQGREQRAARVLVVSRIVPRKGVQHLIEAFLGIESDFELHVVGDGPYLPSLRAMAAGAPRPVTFWGWLDNDDPRLRELYETSAIFCLPSEVENFPVSLLEAMAAGLAVVTTADTGCADVVGDAALLVPPADVEALRAALARLMADPALREELGNAAVRRLNERFTWQAVAGMYLDLYRRAVDGAEAAEGPGARGCEAPRHRSA